MLIGILSDSHDRRPALLTALSQLSELQVTYYIHCGDVGSQLMLDLMAGLPLAFVTGNSDADPSGLVHYGRALGLTASDTSLELTLDDKLLAVTHGDDSLLLENLIESQKYDYVLHGHTHALDNQRLGRTRIINPGALYRATPKTVAVLDTHRDDVQFIPVASV